MAYERNFGRHLAALGEEPISGQWYHFSDAHGEGYCQTDHLIVRPKVVLIFENKLTYRPCGWSQLTDLYLPVVEEVFQRDARRILVCHNLTPEALDAKFASLPEVLEGERDEVLIHWRG